MWNKINDLKEFEVADKELIDAEEFDEKARIVLYKIDGEYEIDCEMYGVFNHTVYVENGHYFTYECIKQEIEGMLSFDYQSGNIDIENQFQMMIDDFLDRY